MQRFNIQSKNSESFVVQYECRLSPYFTVKSQEKGWENENPQNQKITDFFENEQISMELLGIKKTISVFKA